MRLCIPTTDDRGLEARLSPHFGSAPFFMIVEDGDREPEAIVNYQAVHRHGACRPVEDLRHRGVDAVICRGLGGRALAQLRTMGISVLVTTRKDVTGALTEFDAGTLVPLAEDQACSGHEHEAAPREGTGSAPRRA